MEQYQPLTVASFRLGEIGFVPDDEHNDDHRIIVRAKIGSQIVGFMDIIIGMPGAPQDNQFLLTSHPDLKPPGGVEAELLRWAIEKHDHLFIDTTIHISMIVNDGVVRNGLNIQQSYHYEHADSASLQTHPDVSRVITKLMLTRRPRYLAGIRTYAHNGRTVLHMTYKEYPAVFYENYQDPFLGYLSPSPPAG